MKLIHGIEITLAALAAISGTAVWVEVWLAGAIGSDFNPLWMVGYALTLLVVVLGAILDVLANSRIAKSAALVMLSLGTLALLGFGAISFIIEFIAPAVFAFGTTALAFGTLGARRSAPRAA
jgi:hypothetical protein